MSDHTVTPTTEYLESIINRIEALVDERAEINKGINEILDEAVDFGLDKRAIREVIKLRKMQRAEREELESNISLYSQTLNM